VDEEIDHQGADAEALAAAAGVAVAQPGRRGGQRRRFAGARARLPAEADSGAIEIEPRLAAVRSDARQHRSQRQGIDPVCAHDGLDQRVGQEAVNRRGNLGRHGHSLSCRGGIIDSALGPCYRPVTPIDTDR
jgi:hypothetical protein